MSTTPTATMPTGVADPGETRSTIERDLLHVADDQLRADAVREMVADTSTANLTCRYASSRFQLGGDDARRFPRTVAALVEVAIERDVVSSVLAGCPVERLHLTAAQLSALHAHAPVMVRGEVRRTVTRDVHLDPASVLALIRTIVATGERHLTDLVVS